MPRVSAFYGIEILIFWGDHPPPHFHTHYGDHWAKVSISSGRLLEGSLPPRAVRFVREWMRLHRLELEANWERAQALQPLVEMEPLP